MSSATPSHSHGCLRNGVASQQFQNSVIFLKIKSLKEGWCKVGMPLVNCWDMSVVDKVGQQRPGLRVAKPQRRDEVKTSLGNDSETVVQAQNGESTKILVVGQC